MLVIAGGIILAVLFFMFLPIIIPLALFLLAAGCAALLWGWAYSIKPEATIVVSIIAAVLFAAESLRFEERFSAFMTNNPKAICVVIGGVLAMPIFVTAYVITSNLLIGAVAGAIGGIAFYWTWRKSPDRLTAILFTPILRGKNKD